MRITTSVVTKGMFFDRFDAAVEGASFAGLRACGALVHRIAKQSMRRRAKASKPGEPPSARTDRKRGGLLRDRLAFGYDAAAKAVVIGPLPLAGRAAVVPGLHERGGVLPNQRRRRRRLGGAGEIRVLPKVSKTLAGKVSRGDASFRARSTKLARGTRLGDVPVVYAKLLTPGQVARANRINEQLYGEAGGVRYPARPYMSAALRTASLSGRLSSAYTSAAMRAMRQASFAESYARVKGRI